MEPYRLFENWNFLIVLLSIKLLGCSDIILRPNIAMNPYLPTKESKESLLFKILNDKGVVDFVKTNLKHSYQAFFKGHEKKVASMIDKATNLLIESQNHIDNPKKLNEIIRIIDKTIFKKDRPYFWFNRMYQEYKKYVRPRKDYEVIKEYIKGQTVLDFGCGGGYLALELQEDGFNVITTDVLDYRIKLAKNLPFIKMTSPIIIPYPDKIADTTIVKTVLHHIDKKNIFPILKELRRVSSRLIIEEDIYNPSLNLNGLTYLRQTQPILNNFLELSPKRQYLSLVFIDFFANAVAFGKSNINFPFQFKTVNEWRSVLDKSGFNIKKTILKGFEKNKVHTNCQAWIVADKKT